MATESVPAGQETEFNQWRTNYGLGIDGYDFELLVMRGERVIERQAIDIRTLPDRADLLARMPEQWCERFLPAAHEARLMGAMK
jgi:hypothetical protein